MPFNNILKLSACWLLIFFAGVATGWSTRTLHIAKTGPEDLNALAQNGLYPAKLIRVVDGDTLQVWWQDERVSVRLLCINTPERGQPGYAQATAHLREQLASAHMVDLEFETPGQIARDRFGRLLAYVWFNGRNLNIEQVRAGHSRFWTKYGTGHHAAEFRQVEQ